MITVAPTRIARRWPLAQASISWLMAEVSIDVEVLARRDVASGLVVVVVGDEVLEAFCGSRVRNLVAQPCAVEPSCCARFQERVRCHGLRSSRNGHSSCRADGAGAGDEALAGSIPPRLDSIAAVIGGRFCRRRRAC